MSTKPPPDPDVVIEAWRGPLSALAARWGMHEHTLKTMLPRSATRDRQGHWRIQAHSPTAERTARNLITRPPSESTA